MGYRSRLFTGILVSVVLSILWMMPVGAATEVVFVASDNPDRLAFMERLEAELRVAWPDLEVVMTGGGSDRVISLISAGMPPELQRVGMETWGTFARQGLMRDISPLMQRDGVSLDGFFPALAKAVEWDGKVFGVPYDVKIPLLFVNRTLFDNAGIPLPTKDWSDPSWNVDAYVEVARRLTIDRNGDGVPEQFGLERIAHEEQITAVEAFGARWVNADETAFAGDTPEMRRALEFWPRVYQENVGGVWTAGNTAMMMNLLHRAQESEESGLDWDVAALPYEMPVRFSANALRAYHGENFEAAWDLVKRMVLDPRTFAEGAYLWGGLPSSREAFELTAAEGTGLAELFTPAQLDMLLVGMAERAVGPYGGSAYFDEWNRIARDIFLRTLQGELHPDQAIEEARSRIEAVLGS